MNRSLLEIGSTAYVVIASLLALGLIILPPLALVIRAVETRAWEHLIGAGLTEAIGLSLLTTLVAAIVIILLGTPLAYGLVNARLPFQNTVNLIVQLPIVLPPAVAGLALLITFGRRGLLGPSLATFGISLPFSTAAVVIAQSFVALPYYVRAAQIGFNNISPDLQDAARVDGASNVALFRYITLPLALPALTVGLILSWTRALGEFGATILFAGSLTGKTQTLPLLVYNILERDLNMAIWTGIILIIIALGSLAVMHLVLRYIALQTEHHMRDHMLPLPNKHKFQ